MPKSDTDWTDNLLKARSAINSLIDSIHSFPHAAFLFRAPIIDQNAKGAWSQDEVLGLRRFIQSVEDQAVSLDQLAREQIPVSDDPLPNVLTQVAMWKQVLLSRPPLAGIRIPLSPGKLSSTRASVKNEDVKGKGKSKEGFVDIIARGGKEWIKFYSKKESQLLAEFREYDSYINSDFEDSDSDSGPSSSTSAHGSQARADLPTNSLTALAESLLELAQNTDRTPGAPIPKLTIRVSRISDDPRHHHDERISRVFEDLYDRGINLVFGDLSDRTLEEVHNFALKGYRDRLVAEENMKPSLRINLDPTSLMGLCSDLLHHPLPADKSEAKKRFYRPAHALQANGRGRDQLEASPNQDRDLDDDWTTDEMQSQNSRELVRNVLEEMDSSLIEELRDGLRAAADEYATRTGRPAKIEFWATPEAITYAQEALGSEKLVGEGMEQRRLRRLLGQEDGDFFQGSRYERKEGVLHGMRVRTIGRDMPTTDPPRSTRSPSEAQSSSFHRSLHCAASMFLADYDSYKSTGDPARLPNFLKPNRLPVPKVASLSVPFPIVSLISLAQGAKEGMTTLMMGNIVLRDVFFQNRWRIRGWVQGDYETLRPTPTDDQDSSAGEKAEDVAAVWMMPYRSLGEGKRVRFARGDYSYPNK
ncbi:hypothetical protein BD324DRAFT_11941 [Kockovaella imperatae]|uniref:Uncharacterized protein n=1 Tax=Kockovaella imperatae TaxID=4999 RepID=A0A1Y1URD0_9TREE|nr:hypothetical protein BD324DRAFT_11941 [Kockovaella imperatae]ORX40623.1 hypothetical protein BD324DRAFT_11941 [Kockovaella imperatae]